MRVVLDNSGRVVYTVRMIIDTHCHLVHDKYEDLDLVRAESLALGVGHCISQGTHPQDWLPQLELARRMPDFITSCLAAHPSEATNVSDEDFEYMADLCRKYPQAAIGEAGLDYFWDAPEGWDEARYYARQKVLLEKHFALAEELGLNISLHTRDKEGTACFDDAFAIARNFPKVRPVFHCFIGSKEQADAVFEHLDGMVSFTGIITFKKTNAVQEVAAWAPLERVMVETDSPYLSPEPHRGKLNIPGRTRFVAEKLAALRGVSLEEIAAATTANARRFFRLPALGD